MVEGSFKCAKFTSKCLQFVFENSYLWTMSTATLKDTLRDKLEFDVESPRGGLLFAKVDYLPVLEPTTEVEISYSEYILLLEARKLGAEAIYFRIAEGSKTRLPQILIFEDRNGQFVDERLADIHKRIWTAGVIPMYYLTSKTEIRIFDGREKANEENGVPNPFQTLNFVAHAEQLRREYSAKLFHTGLFWDLERNRERFTSDKSAEKFLLDGIRKFRDAFRKRNEGPVAALTNRLIVLSILIKYLEERKDSKGQATLDAEFFLSSMQTISLGPLGMAFLQMSLRL